jgi:inorganic pyrophosphatase/exopolyphosphatase
VTTRINAVIGNEAGDPDSHIAAIAYAYYLSCQHPSELFVALSSVKRSDFKLQLDRVHILRSLGFAGKEVAGNWTPDDLTFIDEIDLEALHRDKRLELTLVDHNEFMAPPALQEAVVGIVDHHQPSAKMAELRSYMWVQFGIGSCCSQVGKLWLDNMYDRITADRVLSSALLAVILLDTVCLDPTKKDQESWEATVAQDLLAGAGEFAAGGMRAYFEELQVVKNDVQMMLKTFTPADFIKQDYKLFQLQGKTEMQNYGFASVVPSLAELALTYTGPGFVAACEAYKKERGLDVLFVCTKVKNERQMAIIANEKDAMRMEYLVRFLNAEDNKEGGLRLSVTDYGLSKGSIGIIVRTYRQENVAGSRKKLVPLVRDFVSNL